LIVTYLNLVVALALGVLALGEHVDTSAIVGLALILAGAWLATDGRLPAQRRVTSSLSKKVSKAVHDVCRPDSVATGVLRPEDVPLGVDESVIEDVVAVQ
jgi:hypothetical protein